MEENSMNQLYFVALDIVVHVAWVLIVFTFIVATRLFHTRILLGKVLAAGRNDSIDLWKGLHSQKVIFGAAKNFI